jgi:hypothetical protein
VWIVADDRTGRVLDEGSLETVGVQETQRVKRTEVCARSTGFRDRTGNCSGATGHPARQLRADLPLASLSVAPRSLWIVSEDEHGPATDAAGGHRSMRVGDTFDRILGGHPRPDYSI